MISKHRANSAWKAMLAPLENGAQDGDTETSSAGGTAYATLLGSNRESEPTHRARPWLLLRAATRRRIDGR